MSLFKSEGNQKRELIIVLKAGTAELNEGDELSKVSDEISRYVESLGAKIEPILPQPASGATLAEANSAYRQLNRYRYIVAPDDKLNDLQAQLVRNPAIEAAYIKPPAELAVIENILRSLGPRAFRRMPEITPDFSGRQNYLDPAPVGIDARYAWMLPGGKGQGVKVIDCESAWNCTHEDLGPEFEGIVIGKQDPKVDDGHGTAMIGIIIAWENGIGITGIAPKATLSGAVFPNYTSKATSTVILQAAEILGPGDIILLEVQRKGPRTPYPPPPYPEHQKGYIPIEWWSDDFLAIAHASAKGILIVEAAGNGREDLDHPDYNKPLPDFPSNWTNPFARRRPQFRRHFSGGR